MTDSNLCVVVSSLFGSGGVPYVARNLIRKFSSEFKKIFVISNDLSDLDSRNSIATNVEVHSISGPLPLFLIRAANKVKQFNNSGIDYLHTHGNTGLIGYLLNEKVINDMTHILTVHGTHLNHIRSFQDHPSFQGEWKYHSKVKIDHFITKRAYTRPDIIHSVSSQTTSELHEMGVTEPDIYTINNGIRLEEFKEMSKNGQIIDEPNCVNIVTVSGIVPRKGLHTVAKAIPELARKKPEQKFSYTHIGPTRLEAYQDLLENDLQKAPENLDYLFTGKIPRNQLISKYKNSDIFISASYSEGCPISILEAGAAGSTVISSDIGGARDVLSDQAIYFETGDVDSLVNSLEAALLADYNLYERIQSQFTWDVISTQFFNGIYNDL